MCAVFKGAVDDSYETAPGRTVVGGAAPPAVESGVLLPLRPPTRCRSSVQDGWVWSAALSRSRRRLVHAEIENPRTTRQPRAGSSARARLRPHGRHAGCRAPSLPPMPQWPWRRAHSHRASCSERDVFTIVREAAPAGCGVSDGALTARWARWIRNSLRLSLERLRARRFAAAPLSKKCPQSLRAATPKRGRKESCTWVQLKSGANGPAPSVGVALLRGLSRREGCDALRCLVHPLTRATYPAEWRFEW